MDETTPPIWKQKWAIGTVVAVLIFGGLHIGRRWQVYYAAYGHPIMQIRAAVVPSELDLSDATITNATTCHVGYATFSLPLNEPIEMTYSTTSAGVEGQSESLSFMFMPPLDPSTTNATRFKKDFETLSAEHPLRQHLSKPGTTFLDFEIYTERMLPIPFWSSVFQNRTDFSLNMFLLSLKASNVGGGMHAVYTYATPEVRGLLRIGDAVEDQSKAHVYLENHAGTQGVGILIELRDREDGNVMTILPTLLSTFRFNVDHVNTKEEAIRILSEAGIPQRESAAKPPQEPN